MKPFRTPKIKKILKEIIDLAIFAACMALVFAYVIKLNIVPTGSMSPAIKPGDIAICSSIPYWFDSPKRGDMVTFFSEDSNKKVVKRVVGLPGETIDIEDGAVFINGELLEEDYIGEGIQTVDYGFIDNVTIPQNHYFVMGDNRENSWDSRFYREPCISEEIIRQKVLFVVRTSELKKWFGE